MTLDWQFNDDGIGANVVEIDVLPIFQRGDKANYCCIAADDIPCNVAPTLTLILFIHDN